MDKEDADIIEHMHHRCNNSQHKPVILTTKEILPKDIAMTIIVGAMAMTCLIGITQELVQRLFKGMYGQPHGRIFFEDAQGQHIR